MNPPAPFTVEFAPSARRRMDKLPLEAAVAPYEHLIDPVAQNPYRLGKPLEVPYDGVWTTRRGDYRAVYMIDETANTVTVVAIAHRRDAYRAP
jgi:mRNA interferase RelE/StbE